MPEFLQKYYDKIDFRALRQFTIGIKKNFAFKLFFFGFTVLLGFSVAMYLVESKYVFYVDQNGQKVEDSANSSNIRTMEQSIWWSIVTSSTTGYGDFYPKSTLGRVIGSLTIFFGMTLVGVITGNIASFLVEKQLKEGRGLESLKLKNHFIICGWKRDMSVFLHDIMGKNKSFLPSEIVLINSAEPELIENMKTDPQLKYVNYIRGDYIDERVLQRGSIKTAKKVLVLADRMVNGSIQEVDSRTVMAVITIKSISKQVYVCAELLDSKFERYLRFSNCDEIVLSSDYNRSLIANASAGSGISHVVSELLNVNADVAINTIAIPKNFIGKPFAELDNHIRNKDRSILLGLLENTGNFYIRKKEALEEAQKTPDISKLVDSLKTVKTLVPNLPVINPEPEYIVKKYTRAIIIEGRRKENISERKRESEDAIV